MKVKHLETALQRARALSAVPLQIKGGGPSPITVARLFPGPGYEVEPGAQPVTAKGFVLAQFVDGKLIGLPVYAINADGLQDMRWGHA